MINAAQQERQISTSLAMVFPGQGSQYLGMMSELSKQFGAVAKRFEEASDVLKFDLWALVQDGPEVSLNQTQNTQPALLAASLATWDIWLELGGALPALLAGHSFGEYSALVCAGGLRYEDAIQLVADRGRYMQEAVPEGEGGMAAILGLETQVLQEICQSVSSEFGVVECANFNAPGQIVVSGKKVAVEAVCELAGGRGAKRALMLAVSVPAHCELMTPAAERLTERLAETPFAPPAIKVIHNADVAVHESPEEIRTVLRKQLFRPVLWVDTVQFMASNGISSVCECGPGKVLSALNKRIDRSLECLALTDVAAIQKAAADTSRSDG